MDSRSPPDVLLSTRAARGVAWSAVGQWGGQLVGLLVYVVLARLLAPAAFGLIAMAGVVIALLESVVAQGFADAVIQRKALTPELRDTAFWSTVTLGLISAGGVVIGGDFISSLFSASELTPVVMAMSLTVPITALGTIQRAILRRKLEFRLLTLVTLGATVSGGAVAVLVALLDGGIWSLVAQALVTATTGTVLLWTVADWRPKARFSTRAFGELGPFAGNLVGANLVNFVNRYGDDLIIGAFLGPVALGFYTVAYRLSWAATRFVSGVASAVALPAFSKLQDDLYKFREAFYTTTRTAAVAVLPMFVGIAVMAPELTTTVFGTQWAPSAPVVRVLAAIGLLHCMFFLNPPAMVAAGRPDWVLKINVLNAFLNVIVILIAVRWGIVAVAAAYALRGYLTAPVPLLVLKSIVDLDLSRYLRQIIRPSGISLAMGALVLLAVTFVEGGEMLRLAAGSAVGVVVYFLGMAAFDRDGLEMIRRLVWRIKSDRPASLTDPS